MMKYVMFQFLGVDVPVIAPGDIVNHDNIKLWSKHGNGVPVSAGFVRIMSRDEVYVTGDSFGLKLKSRPEDADIIKRFLKG